MSLSDYWAEDVATSQDTASSATPRVDGPSGAEPSSSTATGDARQGDRNRQDAEHSDIREDDSSREARYP